MSTSCDFCDRSTNVLSVSYMVHIPFVCYTSVTRTLVGHSLPVTGSVRMRSLRLPCQHSPPLQWPPSPVKPFCKFSVRSASVTFIRLCASTKTHVLVCDLLWMVIWRTGNRVSWTSTACAFCDRSAKVLSVSYRARFKFILSFIHLLHLRLLSVPCPLLFWYVCAPYDFHHELTATETTSITG